MRKKNTTSNKDNLVKVKFSIDNYQGKDEHFLESLWAKPVSDDKYILDNSPFYAYGYSYKDTVTAIKEDDDLMVKTIDNRGGHSTFRVFLLEGYSENDFNIAWEDLDKIGCTYEGSHSRLFSIDVPPGVDLDNVVNILKKYEKDGIWEYEEGYIHKK